jgi:hypothetical protein
MTDTASSVEPKWIVPAGVTVKDASVNVSDLNPVLHSFLVRAGLVHLHLFNAVLTVTSGKDGKHVTSSKHGRGEAVDLRITDLAPELQPVFILAMRVLCQQFNLAAFDESYAPGMSHLHIEIGG